MKEHHYQTTLEWTGNRGEGTSHYRSYTREHQISGPEKVSSIAGSSDPAFRGDRTRYNPEELLLASLSSCHMLWYLHLCAENEVMVTEYVDQARGTMVESKDGGGRFREVTLYPEVTVTRESMIERARELHRKAHQLCFIANSCNFPVYHRPDIKVKSD